MTEFIAGDKVIKKTETDARNFGTVMPSTEQRKPGYVAVYFRRHVWVKPENLMHFAAWERVHQGKPSHEAATVIEKNGLKNYWTANL